MMSRPRPSTRGQMRWRFAIGAAVLTFLATRVGVIPDAQAQGLVQGVQQGAQAGNKAAGPVGGVLGGAIGGVVGVFNGVLGAGRSTQQPAAQQPAANGTKQTGPTKAATKAGKADKPNKQTAVLTQN